MRNGIPEFRPRQPLDRQLSSTTLNDIRRELESLRITRVVNGTFRKLPGGTEIVVAPQRGGGDTPATRQPWDLIARVDPDADPEDENPPYKIRVQPGTLNGILPSNWDEEFTAQPTDLHYAKAVIATDGEAVTGLSIEIDTSAPAIQEPQLFSVDSEIELTFGLFYEGQTFRVIAPGSLILSPVPYLVTDKASPQPGELAYQITYSLQ
jgi:hypothetical protein